MPVSRLRFFKRCAEFIPRDKVRYVPRNTRGIYVLLNEIKPKKNYAVVYVGMAGGKRSGSGGRLNAHNRSKRKEWTHFSVFEAWDNISQSEIQELEGLVRHMFRKDKAALPLNKARKSGLSKVRDNRIQKWSERIRVS